MAPDPSLGVYGGRLTAENLAALLQKAFLASSIKLIPGRNCIGKHEPRTAKAPNQPLAAFLGFSSLDSMDREH
jgi:hypothetical protein